MIEFSFNGRKYRSLYPDLLRPLTFEERADLEGSIKARGIQVPVLVDDTDGLIDGQHRCLIAEGCGLAEIPVRVVAGLSDEDKRALAVELNDCRRQQTAHELGQRRKTRAEKRAAIAAKIITDPQKSDELIAEEVSEKIGEKVSRPTVGRVRGRLVQSGELNELPRTTGKDGKSRPARRKVATDTPLSQSTPANPPATNHHDEAPPVPAPAPAAPKPPPKPRRPAFDWQELSRRLDGTRAKLDAAAASVRMFGSGGDPSLIPDRLNGVRGTLADAADLIEEVIQWHKEVWQA